MLNWSKINNQCIFVTALNWGMGHLSRTAALIKLLQNKNQIIIFCDNQQLKFFNQLFPKIEKIILPCVSVNYFPQSFFKSVCNNYLKFIKSYYQEKYFLQKYLQKTTFKPDLIISDSRYGFYHSGFKSIIITHQLEMQLPLHLSFFNLIHKKLLKQFDEIWVPDYEEDNKALAGKLSRTKDKDLSRKVRYIEPLSLMEKMDTKKTTDYLFIISGTEAEREYFEKIFLNFSEKLMTKGGEKNIKIIGGFQKDKKTLEGWKDFDEMNRLLQSAKKIITRSGYSTLMDVHTIMDNNQELFLVNSKYQFEQRYLYHYWIERGWAKNGNADINTGF